MKKIKYFALLCITSLSVLSHSANAAVWDTVNQWDDTWEERYRAWVKTNLKDDIFMNPAKPIYYKFENDCADAVYAMRLMFSYENNLPFVVNNQQSPGKLISNDMKTWDNLPPPVRVRKFMDYVADMTSTKSLRQDTYPIALAEIRPGDLYVAPGVHSYQIVNVTDPGIAEVQASTTPKSARYLLRTPSFPFYVPEDKNFADGYRRFKQPQNIRLSQSQQPGFSTEQFQLARDLNFDYVAFTDVISRKLGKRAEKPDEKTLRLLLALCMYANDRSVYVYDALWYLQKVRREGRQCLTAREYDDHSTPGRDKRLTMFFDSVRHHLDRIGRFDPHSVPARWAKAVFSRDKPPKSEMDLLNKFCMVQMTLGEEYYMTLRDLRKNVEDKLLVSDPHAPLEYRWGLVKTPYKPTCPTY
ncbi:hypothetical protein [Thiofilum flexile]|uniref:hypothetical protein n=1 Tax=Thiofilum flexile TaxID=125627 RepID=UPI00036CF641|nr:hypothetical protein [Thiofilum flexile]